MTSTMFQNPFVKISIVLVFVVVACVPTVWGRARRGDDKLLKKTIRGVELGLSFFSQDYSSINVDGLFGLRVGQGETAVILFFGMRVGQGETAVILFFGMRVGQGETGCYFILRNEGGTGRDRL